MDVLLCYQNGKSQQQGTLVDQWMTSNYNVCYEKKNALQDAWKGTSMPI